MKRVFRVRSPRPRVGIPPLLSLIPLLLALLLGACQGEVEGDGTPTPGGDPVAATCDAGDDAFVQRAMPLMWGRRPHGAAEVKIWSELARTQGREAVVLAMAEDPAYLTRWQSWITDALGVARTGDRVYAACFGTPRRRSHNGDLARGMAAARATDAPRDALASGPFNMADVIRSSLVADDLSVPWRANLFARMNRPVFGANVGPFELENNRRVAFGDEFFNTYLSRNLTCLPCHNSEYSVTGSDDPATDRTWEIPGLYELALLGSSYGRDRETAYAVFRYTDLVRGDDATAQPWGLDAACGTFTPEGLLGEDYLGHEGYFIEAFGEAGSVWQVEAALDAGVRALKAGGVNVAEGGRVEGPEAFAWLVAVTLADRVWEESTGARLTIATAFPRNQAQRDILWGLAESFVHEGYSLKALLVALTQHPYFNAGVACGAKAYGMQPVYNPWTLAEEDPALRMNGPGDQVRRNTAQTLITSVHDTLGWAKPALFLARGDPMLTLQTNLGAYMRTSQPGFNGTDFQGALAFEATYGACARPEVGGAGDGCRETPGFGGCASCDCQSCVCGIEPYCCDVQWDALCVSLCNEGCGGCGGGLAAEEDDVVDRILAGAKSSGATVGDVVTALKDRMLARGEVAEAEEALIEDLLSQRMGDRVADAPELEEPLRILCGAWLLSPGTFLAMEPEPVGAIPPLALDVDEDCQRAVGLFAARGVTLSCPLEVQP